MRYFIDTEYDFNADWCRVVPISIGVVAEDGREFYGVTTMFAPRECSQYVQDVVLPVLADPTVCVGFVHEERGVIGREIRSFVGDDPSPEFWGDWSDFDYVVLAILMDGFDNWPRRWPMFLHDLQQTPEGREASARVESSHARVHHHALADARAVRDAYRLAFGG